MKKIATLIVLAITGIVSVNTFAQGFGGGMNLGAGRRCFHLGLPLRAVYVFPGRAKLFAGVSASVRLGSNAACPVFAADAECGVSFYGYGLRFGYTLTPAWGGARAISLGLVIGI